jgi:hypothetical protein
MEPEGSLPCSQDPTTYPCSKPDESNPHPVSLRSILILASHLRLWFHFYRFSYQNVVWTYSMRATCHIHLILLDFIVLIIYDNE